MSLVPISALVRDSRNRIVRNLRRDDFQVFEGGRLRTIVDFGTTDDAAMAVAFLFDTSGSMGVAANLSKGRDFVEEVVGGISPQIDHVALFTFNKRLREDVPFTNDPDNIFDALNDVRPWGLTSLYDAIAEAAKQVANQSSFRRAVVVVTDGVDTSSALTPAQVSAIASSIDVPVYVIVVVSPFDKTGRKTLIDTDLLALKEGPLGHLARWTGGEIIMPVSAEDLAAATQQLVTELRHQYLMAFEPGGQPGWHPLEVRTRRTDLTVRARSGYVVPARTGVSEKVAGVSHQRN